MTEKIAPITNLERVMMEVLNKPQGIEDLRCSFDHWIDCPRTYISIAKIKHGIHLNHVRCKSKNRKRFTRYQCPDASTAKQIIALLNHKAIERNAGIAITEAQEQRILSRFPLTPNQPSTKPTEQADD